MHEKSNIKLVLSWLTLSTVLLFLSACTVGPTPMPDDPEYAPVLAHTKNIPKANPGGIYQPGFGVALFTDRRATRVGDLIIIVLNESTSAQKSGKTEIKKDTDLEFNAARVLDTLPSFKNLGLLTDLEQKRDFAGESTSDQSNSLRGSIAVTVSEVLPNGLLVVRGEKWLTLNKGKEYIRIRGIIRQSDVNPDNTISSTKVADARITYSGTGDLADSNDMGWVSRVFNSRFWPF